MQLAQHEHGNPHRNHAKSQIAEKEHQCQAAQARVTHDVAQCGQRISKQGPLRIGSGDWLTDADQGHRRNRRHGGGEEQGCLRPESRHHEAGGRRTDDAGERVQAGIQAVRPVPKGLRQHERKERTSTSDTEDVADTEDRNHHQQEGGREPVGQRQRHDGRRQSSGHGIVEDHQPNSSLAIEEGAGDRAEGKPGKDRGQDGEAREAW